MSDETARYDRVISVIETGVKRLNEALGLDASHYSNPRVSFGYIGNCDFTPTGVINDDRRWMIFLPHPGRVGTSKDSLGGFRTGDLKGAVNTLVALNAALRLAEWQKEQGR